MLRLSFALPLLFAHGAMAAFSPDTGIVAQVSGYTWGGRQALHLEVGNASRTPKDQLGVRIFLTSDSAQSADFALRVDLAFLTGADGFVSPGAPSLDSAVRKAHSRPLVAGCKTGCFSVVEFPLPNLVLGPLQSLRLDLITDKFLLPGTDLLNAAPTHALSAQDWSLANIPLNADRDNPLLRRGHGPLARHIQIVSNGKVIWGNAPGEPETTFPSLWKRQGLPTPFAAIRTAFPDSASQQTRDSANLKLSKLLVNQAGYREIDVRAGTAWIQAIGPTATTFSVLNTHGTVVGQGNLVAKAILANGQFKARGSNWAGDAFGGDLAYEMTSAVRTGTLYQGRLPSQLAAGGPYRIAVGSDTSMNFLVDDRIYSWLRDAELRFLGAQRSGSSQSWLHGSSHVDDPAPGGWYDCGDHLKEAQTQGFTLATLGMLAATHPERDADRTGYNHDSTRLTDGIPDLLRELKHGADYVLGSWDRNGKSAATLISSVGEPGSDRSGWAPSDWSDLLPSRAGGQASRQGRVDTGADVQAKFAAGLAFYSQAWKPYNSAEATQALTVAKALYAAAKSHPNTMSPSPTYNGAPAAEDELAFAAVALLWATHDTAYLNDLAYNTSIGHYGTTGSAIAFQGGWLANRNPTFTKGNANLNWGYLHPLALYAFHRLILRDSATAAGFGIPTDLERRALDQRVGRTMAKNLGALSNGSMTAIALPGEIGNTTIKVGFDSAWHALQGSQTDNWNRTVASNATELGLYAEIAADLQADQAARGVDTLQWNATSSREMGLRQLDFLLGVNPWDLSMVLGVGGKTPNHPNHRTANPEGRTIGFPYTYTTLDGAVYPGYAPTDAVFADSWADSRHCETCLEGSTSLLAASVAYARDTGNSTTNLQRNRTSAKPARFDVFPTARGTRIQWSGAQGELEAIVTEGTGRRLASFRSELPEGSAEIILPPHRGNLYLLLRNARGSQAFGLRPL